MTLQNCGDVGELSHPEVSIKLLIKKRAKI